MIHNRDEGLVSPSDIADIAGVSRGAVSNWRKRTQTFPAPVAGTPSKPLFSRGEVTEWLERHASKTKNESVRPRAGESGEMDVWSALNLLRDRLSADDAAELVLSLAVARKNESESPTGVPNVDEKTLSLVKQAVERIAISDLGAAADFALERLARSQGKLGANSGFVGSRTTTLLANLAAARPGGVLYDPACGIAAALLETVRLGARPDRMIGHDIDRRALQVAAQRATLHDVDLELTPTDVLAEDIDPGLRADVVVLEPPFGLRLDASRRLTDARFDFGAPPRSSADTAWLQHAVAHLADDGRAYVLSPAGTLFRGGEEGRIRTELVKRGCVEAIVGLPGKLLPHTSIPLALWVLRRPVRESATEHILFIDASETVAPEQEVAVWLTDASAREGIPQVEVAITDVLAAESVLTPQRWVDRTEREPSDVAYAYQHGWSAITETVSKLQNVLQSFEHFASFSKSRVMTVGELIDQGVLDMRMGRPKDRYQDAPAQLRERLATAADVRDDTLREVGIDGEYADYPELTTEGDVLVTTMNTIRARVDDVGGHLPSTGVYRLRVRDRDVLSPGYLAIALSGSWNERFQGGTTIQRASIKDLEVPLVPLAEQRDLQLAVLSIQLLHEHSAHLAREASTVGSALLDAVRYNANLANPDLSVGQTDHDGPVDSEGAK
ncbi:N-6 DNA methylase [Aeromicrobium halocynthiae]|uniref:N-6 DNA methylase n=1 Tax=Aeromicrobium halocynthiae TaxID=560557 RepID=A0ABN2W0U6_9ACTN